MGKVYYCSDCEKDYEYIRVKRKERFRIDEDEYMEIDCIMDVCPVCGNGYFIDPFYKDLEKMINKRRQEKKAEKNK